MSARERKLDANDTLGQIRLTERWIGWSELKSPICRVMKYLCAPGRRQKYSAFSPNRPFLWGFSMDQKLLFQRLFRFNFCNALGLAIHIRETNMEMGNTSGWRRHRASSRSVYHHSSCVSLCCLIASRRFSMSRRRCGLIYKYGERRFHFWPHRLDDWLLVTLGNIRSLFTTSVKASAVWIQRSFVWYLYIFFMFGFKWS